METKVGENEVPFEPSYVDIVCTKIRTWNTKHPGNVFYTNLIQKTIETGEVNDVPKYRAAAEDIFQILVCERGGRFLKLAEGVSTAETCTILPRKRCIDKIVHALKTAQNKQGLKEVGILQPYSKQAKHKDKENSDKSNESSGILKESRIVSPQITNNGIKRVSSSGKKTKLEVVSYKAVAGSLPIHKHALELINVVCRQSNPESAYRALDIPRPPYSSSNEPEKERLMRLQLRQRFASAVSTGMTPVEFARRLLSFWGGKLVETEPLPRASPKKATKVSLVETPKGKTVAKLHKLHNPVLQSTPPASSTATDTQTLVETDISINVQKEKPGKAENAISISQHSVKLPEKPQTQDNLSTLQETQEPNTKSSDAVSESSYSEKEELKRVEDVDSDVHEAIII